VEIFDEMRATRLCVPKVLDLVETFFHFWHRGMIILTKIIRQ
jgi:hypothetical protein